ncbi:helix-turn-helix domain-containing protein [Staphylococcus epidermidis]|uniref:helix-turn-helix domain-containing protein n=1 Tax=Staphylococcus epidermidis TaxID=1282 RepID=UPI0002EAA230|nr:helix-turn-helix transcriptional regulator [Staphylococcus epidermidis]MBM0796624.1 XRE family transcriptional regulator [Staphylococcus epidermidis]MBM0836464.1 XRE family transcriptional regulator [Staphylococcus epidermidis]MBM0873703.1 XRE family transcriptional regulator [Staphylococcus epidermidis]MEB6269418.1 helix-turn-helix domain-containing protein [Staphylococcus epidermidis]QGY86824.1 helix-turn-helix transcriptional regulator [Staphylococcus epidermidis]
MLGADAIPYDKNKKELRNNEKLSEDTNSKYMQTTKKIRIDKHISQEDIAFDLDVSASYISQVENGKKEYISLYFVLVMCEYYDMPLSQILYEVEY